MTDLPKMDYVIVVYNDINTIMSAIESIRKQQNVNKLIVVASERSTDGTLEKMKDLRLNNVGIDVLLTENIGLAYARMIAIQEVNTEWFVFVDSDVALDDNWAEDIHKQLLKLNDLKLGAIFGYLYRDDAHEKDLKEHSKVKQVTGRMFTHNTMIKSELVKDWTPDESINSYEDYLLTQHIIAKGYNVFSVPVFGFHDHRSSLWKEAVWGGAGANLSKYYKRITGPMKYMVGSIYGGLKRTLRQRKIRFLKNAIIVGVGTFWGYLRADKYRKKT